MVPGQPRTREVVSEDFPVAVLLRPQGDIGKTSIHSGYPVETAEPEGHVDCRQADETPPSSDHVYLPGAFALDFGCKIEIAGSD